MAPPMPVHLEETSLLFVQAQICETATAVAIGTAAATAAAKHVDTPPRKVLVYLMG